jgi:hypothetical protein
MTDRRAFLSGLCAIGAASLGEQVAWGQLPDLVTRIAKARAGVRSFHAAFTQVRAIGLLAAEVRSRGRMILVRPDRLRWDLDPPDAVTFWIGPEGASYRSPNGHGKLADPSVRLSGALDDVRSILGGNLERLEARWRLRLLRDDADGVEVEATAIDSRRGAPSKVLFALAADLVRPTRLVLSTSPHDTTAIEFTSVVLNDPVDASFAAPE